MSDETLSLENRVANLERQVAQMKELVDYMWRKSL